jgi:hypothetical protein
MVTDDTIASYQASRTATSPNPSSPRAWMPSSAPRRPPSRPHRARTPAAPNSTGPGSSCQAPARTPAAWRLAQQRRRRNRCRGGRRWLGGCSSPATRGELRVRAWRRKRRSRGGEGGGPRVCGGMEGRPPDGDTSIAHVDHFSSQMWLLFLAFTKSYWIPLLFCYVLVASMHSCSICKRIYFHLQEETSAFQAFY